MRDPVLLNQCIHSRPTRSACPTISECRAGAGVKGPKATRRRAALPKLSRNGEKRFHGFRTKCFRSAMRPRIAFWENSNCRVTSVSIAHWTELVPRSSHASESGARTRAHSQSCHETGKSVSLISHAVLFTREDLRSWSAMRPRIAFTPPRIVPRILPFALQSRALPAAAAPRS